MNLNGWLFQLSVRQKPAGKPCLDYYRLYMKGSFCPCDTGQRVIVC